MKRRSASSLTTLLEHRARARRSRAPLLYPAELGGGRSWRPPHVQLAPVRLLGVALASETLAVFYSLAAVCREGGGPGAAAARPACACEAAGRGACVGDARCIRFSRRSSPRGMARQAVRVRVLSTDSRVDAELGSQQVHDIQGTYERNAQGTEEY